MEIGDGCWSWCRWEWMLAPGAWWAKVSVSTTRPEALQKSRTESFSILFTLLVTYPFFQPQQELFTWPCATTHPQHLVSSFHSALQCIAMSQQSLKSAPSSSMQLRATNTTHEIKTNKRQKNKQCRRSSHKNVTIYFGSNALCKCVKAVMPLNETKH